MDVIPELSDKQLDRLSEFFSNLSLVIMASLVLPNLFGAKMLNLRELLGGIILTIGLLLISMILVRREE